MNEYQKIEKYTRQRMQELRGETHQVTRPDPFIERYTARRIRELRLENEMRERKVNLDNVALGGYTVATMEAYSGKS